MTTTLRSSSSFEDPLFPNNKYPLSIITKPSIFKLPKDLIIKKSHMAKVFSRDESSSKDSPSFFRNKSQISHSRIPSITPPQSELQTASPENGDLFNVIITRKIKLDDLSNRTYFHQLITALEALHSQGEAHLNLKLENLLLNEHFTLKLADANIQERNVNYIAPEALEGDLSNPQAADIYSLGIILFVLKTGGNLPFDDSLEVDMRELAKTNKHLFWKNQCKILNQKASFFGYDFRKLFMRMTDSDPLKRPSLEEIRGSVWCSKNIYDDQELFDLMKNRVGLSI